MEEFLLLLGRSGMVWIIALGAFILSYMNSDIIFTWIENQTYGTRDYILKQLEILVIKFDPDRLTYLLLLVSFGPSFFLFTICALFGKFTLGFILAVVFFLLGWKLPRPFINILVQRRILIYETQMVDAPNLLSNGLRAGLSLPQAVGMIVDEMPAPVSEEFSIILQQNKIGVPLDECFDNLKKRIPTEDNEMFVTSVSILRETGGNLAEVFESITGVIRERIRLKQKIDTYIATGKMQGGVIACMPTAMLIISYMSNPESVTNALGSTIGIIMLVVAYALNFAGAFAIWKVIQIKV